MPVCYNVFGHIVSSVHVSVVLEMNIVGWPIVGKLLDVPDHMQAKLCSLHKFSGCFRNTMMPQGGSSWKSGVMALDAQEALGIGLCSVTAHSPTYLRI